MDTGNKPHYLGHRQRLKAKFKDSGFDSFADYEILEFILTFSIARKDTKPLAKELIKIFGSIKQVFDADIEDLMKVKGVSEHTAVLLAGFSGFAKIYSYMDIKEGSALSSPEAVADYLITELGGQKTEKFYAVLLNSGNKIIECLEIEKGTVNKSVIFPRKVAQAALKHNASAVIIAHNHPGGTLKPSQDDIEATTSVKNALAAVEVALLDHIIVAGKNYLSFKEYNLL